ncbi:MAG: glycosyltransferase [Bacteroidaceae bacterium]|nr:glycosyltransferase [Bacteroidaceae bacterium]
MKVLFFVESLAGGGAEKVLATLVQHLDKSKFDVTVCVVSGGGRYEDEVKQCCNYKALLNIPSSPIERAIYKIKHHLIYKWLPMWLVYMLFVPKGNDVEVAFVEGFATKLMAASTNEKARKVAWVHIDLHRFHWTKEVFHSHKEEEDAYNCYDAIVVVSKTAEDAIQQEFNLTVPVQTIYNPVDCASILGLSEQKKYIIPRSHACRLVSVGRFSKQKAYMRLLSIVKRLRNDDYDIELWLLGDGTEKEAMQEFVSNNNLKDVVTFFGFLSNPYQYLVQGDLFVCSSISEGFSTAITEALILGLPVVSTEVSGVREQLNNGCGIVTENNEDSLFDGVKYLVTHRDELDKMSRRAMERGKEFRLDMAMKRIESVLQVGIP